MQSHSSRRPEVIRKAAALKFFEISQEASIVVGVRCEHGEKTLLRPVTPSKTAVFKKFQDGVLFVLN